MAHPMESEYVMLETFTEAQPASGAEELMDTATVSSADMERLNQEAGAASTALRHAQDEPAAGLIWPLRLWQTGRGGRLRYASPDPGPQDANKGTDIPEPATAAPSVPGASGPAAAPDAMAAADLLGHGQTTPLGRGLHRPAGETPFTSMCKACHTPWPDAAMCRWMCKCDHARVPATWHLLYAPLGTGPVFLTCLWPCGCWA